MIEEWLFPSAQDKILNFSKNFLIDFLGVNDEVTICDGRKFIINDNLLYGDCLLSEERGISTIIQLSSYDENLYHRYNHAFDIVEILYNYKTVIQDNETRVQITISRNLTKK